VLLGESLTCLARVDAGGLLLVDKRVVVALELVVEDYPCDAAALALDFAAFGGEKTIELGVMRELARLDESGMERLRRCVGPVGSAAMRFQERSGFPGEREDPLGA